MRRLQSTDPKVQALTAGFRVFVHWNQRVLFLKLRGSRGSGKSHLRLTLRFQGKDDDDDPNFMSSHEMGASFNSFAFASPPALGKVSIALNGCHLLLVRMMTIATVHVLYIRPGFATTVHNLSSYDTHTHGDQLDRQSDLGDRAANR